MVKFLTNEPYEFDFAALKPILEQIKASDFGGWTRAGVDAAELVKIKEAARKIQDSSEFLVCIGIGGSYLGHRAVVEALAGEVAAKSAGSAGGSELTESAGGSELAGSAGGSELTSSAGIVGSKNARPVRLLFAGNSLSDFELRKILETIDGHDFSLNVISKSGTTTEPAVAFRILKQKLIEKYGANEAKKRIYATTDAAKGALHDEAVQKGYATFVVPDDIGGRYSVLTAVGLLPIAAAGVDVDALLAGAQSEAVKAGLLPAVDELGEEVYSLPWAPAEAGVSGGASSVSSGASSTSSVVSSTFTKNPVADSEISDAYQYAFTRAALANRDFDVEVLASFEPRLAYFHEWWKQLFGESEGKNGQGIFPASAVYTTDLHSLGQFMQQGRRNIFETVISFGENSSKNGPSLEGLTSESGSGLGDLAPEGSSDSGSSANKDLSALTVPHEEGALDGLTYLEGKTLDEINQKALEATVEAHRAGKIPVFEIRLEKLDAYNLGALIYFFELACAVSALLQGVDPFDQPGVEQYKREMFRLLGKPGF